MSSPYFNADSNLDHNVITPEIMIDMRMQGMTFVMMSKHFGINRSALHRIYQSFKTIHFNGYQPIDPSLIEKDLTTDLPLYKIADSYGLTLMGLRNYIDAYDIPSRLNIENVDRILKSTLSKQEILDYFGLTHFRSITEFANKFAYANPKLKTDDFVFSAGTMIDMRMQGLSFAMIAKHFGIDRSSIYYIYKKQKAVKFNGYQPIDLALIEKDFASDRSFLEIAESYHLTKQGLRNYIEAYDIPSRLNAANLNKVLTTTASHIEIMDFFGIDDFRTIIRFAQEQGITLQQHE